MEGKGKKNTNSFFLFFSLSRSTIFVTLFNILHYKVILLMSMINPDNLQAGQIQRKLQSKEFILIKNEKNNHELWNHDPYTYLFFLFVYSSNLRVQMHIFSNQVVNLRKKGYIFFYYDCYCIYYFLLL